MASWEGLFALWEEESDHTYFGASDHGLGFFLPEIMERADPRVLIVDRPLPDVKRSLLGIGLQPGNFCELLAEALEYQHPNIRRVGYSDLADTGTVVSLLSWLMPGIPINHGRIERLQGENIQGDVKGAIADAAKRHGEVRGMLMPAAYFDRLRA